MLDARSAPQSQRTRKPEPQFSQAFSLRSESFLFSARHAAHVRSVGSTTRISGLGELSPDASGRDACSSGTEAALAQQVWAVKVQAKSFLSVL